MIYIKQLNFVVSLFVPVFRVTGCFFPRRKFSSSEKRESFHTYFYLLCFSWIRFSKIIC